MLGNYYTLSALALSSAKTLTGRKIAACYSQERDVAVLALDGITQALVAVCRPDLATFYLDPRQMRARRNSADVLQGCPGKTIEGVHMDPSDRQLAVDLSGGCTLVGLFYGAGANLLLCDEQGLILDALRDARTLRGTAVRRRPASEPADITRLHPALREAGARPAAAVIRHLFPALGGVLVSELLFRARLADDTPAASIPSAAVDRLEHAAAALLMELGAATPRVYTGIDGAPGGLLLSLAELLHCPGAEARVFTDIHEAVRHRLHRGRAMSAFDSAKRTLELSLEKARAKEQRRLDAMRGDLDRASRADDYERYGRLLLAAATDLPKGTASARLADEVGEMLVPLEPSLTAVQNAQRWFEKAKRARAARREAGARLARVERAIAETDRLLELLRPITHHEELRTFMEQHGRGLAPRGALPRDADPRPPFRIFTVEGGFQVLAGKNSANNDLLTLRNARPDDLWFHARGCSGSHVILRVGSAAGTPGKRAKEQAAAIAAYYSRMRNASSVPVAMTERKYVRKPKGAPPGTVVIERERVLFAAPALPEGSAEEEA